MQIKYLTPMLATHNLKETIEFYENNLGFECRGFYPEKENACWASLWNGNVEIAFSVPENDREISMSGSIYLHVEKVDELWEVLKDKVEIAYPPNNFDYGMREFGIKDCNGYLLHIGENIN